MCKQEATLIALHNRAEIDHQTKIQFLLLSATACFDLGDLSHFQHTYLYQIMYGRICIYQNLKEDDSIGLDSAHPSHGTCDISPRAVFGVLAEEPARKHRTMHGVVYTCTRKQRNGGSLALALATNQAGSGLATNCNNGRHQHITQCIAACGAWHRYRHGAE